MEVLNRYRDKILCFNDDIQGTGAVAVAGILGALKQRGDSPGALKHCSIAVAGAGSAGLGVVSALVNAMVQQGATEAEAISMFYVVDVDGVLDASNPNITDGQRRFARSDGAAGMSLEDVITNVKPSILLGLTAVTDLFSDKLLENMAANHDRPIVFPLSNPTAKPKPALNACTAHRKAAPSLRAGVPLIL